MFVFVGRKLTNESTIVYSILCLFLSSFQKIMQDHMNLKADDFVVDIGHGIGNSCLQAAYTFGCQTRGIECLQSRNNVAQILAWRLEDAAQVHQTRDKMVRTF